MKHSIHDISIRPEQPDDYTAIRRLVKEAFASAEHSDGDEHRLVDRLRDTAEYIPGLSLVALLHGQPVGHIMFSRILIGNEPAVALAPLAIAPALQRKGIGTSLIEAGHATACEMGYSCAVVLGAPGYYTRFGYVPAAACGIIAPFDVAPAYFMARPLHLSRLPRGHVRYSPAFGL